MNIPIYSQSIIHCHRCGRRRKDLKSEKIFKLNYLQPIIYVRENINNLSYRERHFSNQYIRRKSFEENHRYSFKADSYCQSLIQLQYQTLIRSVQLIPITTLIYRKSKQSLLNRNDNQYSENSQTDIASLNEEKKLQLIDKIKQILIILNSTLVSHSPTMTIDSLTQTYSVSSIFDIENEISSIEFDSLNNNYYSENLTLAKNHNCYQETSDEESKVISSSPLTIQYMSPSFMSIFQILFLISLISHLISQIFQ